MKKYVYSFGEGAADGDGKMKETLGGKGAGLAEMSRAKLPVPPGFTIATDVCNIYFSSGNKVPAEIDAEMDKALALLQKRMAQKLGDTQAPGVAVAPCRDSGFPNRALGRKQTRRKRESVPLPNPISRFSCM